MDDMTKNALRDLQRAKPAKVRVHASDDSEPRTISIADLGRNRWHRLAKLLDGIEWTRIEALNGRGELIGECVAELEDAPIVSHATAGGDVERMVATFTSALAKVHESAVKQRGSEIDRAMGALERIAGTLVDAMEVLRQSYEMALKLQAAALTASGVDQAAGGDDAMHKLLAVLGPLVMQQQARARTVPAPAPPRPRPVNGHGAAPPKQETPPT